MSLRMLIPSIRSLVRDAHNYLPAWLHPDEDMVRRIQLAKLRVVWADAVQNVPYYKGLVESKRAPKEIDSIEQYFCQVPKLERKTIQYRRHEFERLNRQPDLKRATGGSTGEPLQFGVFNSELQEAAADALVGRAAHGMDLESDKLFIFFGHSHLLGTGWQGKSNHLLRKLKDLLLNYRRSDAYRLDAQNVARTFDEIIRFKPQVLYGYSCAIDVLVRLNMARRAAGRALGLKMVITTAEPLPKPESKHMIENFFGARVLSEFGGVDFGTVAYEKPAGRYGIFWWNQLAEVGADAQSVKGMPLLLTPLYIRYLPLIRYYSGDSVSGGNHTSNHGMLEFESLEGRINDTVTIGEDVIHSVALAHCVKDEPSISNMQLILEDFGIRLVLVGKKDAKLETRIRRRMDDLSAHFQNCLIEFSEDLETTLAGKRHWVVDRRTRAL